MLTLIIPVYRNESCIPRLLNVIEQLWFELDRQLEAVFVVDGSPDRCYELLLKLLPTKKFPSQLTLLSKNFGSFQAIRVGLSMGRGEYFAVMAADMQEPPELVIEMNRRLSTQTCDVVLGVRDSRNDPLINKIPAQIFWWLYQRYVANEVPVGGVDIFGCNREFRDVLLQLEESHSSLIAQVFWLGFRREFIPYVRLARQEGVSAWTFRKKVNYLTDSIFSFTDLPIRLLSRVGAAGMLVALALALIVLFAKLLGILDVPGYATTLITITFFGALNLFGLGIIGSYVWRAYENTKRRPLAIVLRNVEITEQMVQSKTTLITKYNESH